MQTNKKNISNPDLKTAIAKMQEDNSQENVNRMIDCVMSAKFITPGVMSKPKNVAKNDGKGGTVMQQQTQVQFQLIENGNKEKFFPAFTDKEEMGKWAVAKGKQELIMTFDDYAGVLSDPNGEVQGFVVNPFGKSVAFPKPMVMSLKQQKDQMKSNSGLQQQTISADEKVELGDPDPDEYPIDMMAAIINFLNERDDVKSAYLRMFRREDSSEESYLVIVDFEGDKMEEIFKGISTVAAPHLGGYQLSMMPYSVPFAQNAVADVEPFFEAEQ
jgi:hypothetical protein